MKILQIVSSLNPSSGGPAEWVKQISEILEQQNHSIEIACFDRPSSAWLIQSPQKIHALGPGFSRYHYLKNYIRWLMLKSSEYDCIIINGIWQYASFGAWLAMHESNIPYFIFPHGMLDPWFNRRYPLKHLKKSLYWPWAEYRVLKDARAVLFTCEEEMSLARKSFWPYECREAVVTLGITDMGSKVELQRYTFLNRFPELKGKRLILFLGRIHPKKGCDYLIKAFAAAFEKDSSLCLVMVGPDQVGWAQRLKSLSERLGIQNRIAWTGMLEGDLKWGAYYASEVFILPSHQENFGIAVVEALACGVPVLISNKVNIWREIINDGAGFVANDDLEGTIELLKKWFSLNEIQKSQMEEKARICFLRRFEIQKCTENLIDILRQNGVKG